MAVEIQKRREILIWHVDVELFLPYLQWSVGSKGQRQLQSRVLLVLYRFLGEDAVEVVPNHAV